MTLESSKTLGGVGALLMVIGPFLGVYTGVLGLVGLILVMIALKGLSDHYNEGGIFNNALYGAILAIIGGVVFVAVIVVAAVGFLSALGIHWSTLSDPTALSSINWQELVTLDILLHHIAAIVGAFVVLFVFVVVAAIFLRRSLTVLSAKTEVGMFGTTGLLMLIGAVLTIIGVGLILLWVALILLTVAFFSIKTQPAQPPESTPSTP
jgi:uncharacterized membrane protein